MANPNIDIDEFFKNPPSPQQLEEFLNGDQTEPKWHKFARGAYSTPINWWMCHIHIAMLCGLWGEEYQRKAGATQSKFNFFLEEAIMRYGTEKDVILKGSNTAWKHHKSYLAGRGAGGGFITLALVRVSRGRIAGFYKLLAGFSNFVLASFGTGIYLTASGVDSLDELMLGVLTGETNRNNLRKSLGKYISNEDAENWDNKAERMKEYIFSRKLIEQVENINDIDPVIMEFCENNGYKPEFEEYCERKGNGTR